MALCILPSFCRADAVLFGGRRLLPDSVKLPSGGPKAQVTRYDLSARERSETLNFSIALKMRNFADLEARIGRGEQVSQDVMEAQYLPAASDYTAVEFWLVGQGFTITQQDPSHTNVFASGTVAQIESAFDVRFGRVATADGEFTSAISNPSLPSEFADATLAVVGLQPEIRLHHQQPVLSDVVTLQSGFQGLAPSDLLAAYKVPLSDTGSGQTIALVDNATVPPTDLTTFFSTAGSSQLASNVSSVLINGGPTAAGQAAGASEASLDAEWAGAMAPGAKLRVYLVPDGSTNSVIAGCSQILADASTFHITVVSLSYADNESHYAAAVLQSDSQVFAQMAAAGITVLASSGDGGSNPNTDFTLGYNSSNVLGVQYPASDPNVTGVGGTTTILTSGSFSYVSDATWNQIANGKGFASGGGTSAIFSRPSWQTDGGAVLSGATNRCVPDIAATASWQVGPGGAGSFFEVLNGVPEAAGGGTSLACPVWAGITADINQARANLGLGSLGLLGPSIYPLSRTSSFNDITTGNNGAYSAGLGYDLCTGLGSPNVTNLIAALTIGTAPTISGQPQPVTTTAGSPFSLSVTATGTGTLSYQWSLNGGAITGATGATYSVASATAANAGSYTVLVSNSFGAVTSSAAAVTVNAAAMSAPSSGGGGGAPSLWFYLALALVAALRKSTQLEIPPSYHVTRK